MRRFAALEPLDTELDIYSAWESVKENMKMSKRVGLS
jgi:hypothetical protein